MYKSGLTRIDICFVSPNMSLKQDTIIGIAWSVSARILLQGMGFVISVILARLIIPAEFGLIAMIAVFAGFVGLFSQLGFGAAIIQRKEIEDRHLSSIFWLNILCGLILTGVMLSIAPLIAAFYGEPRLKLLVMFISVNFFIGSFGTVQDAILKRSMAFRKLAIIGTGSTLISGSCAITLAFLDFGAWSLAWQTIVSTIVSVVLMWQAANWKPSFYFDKNAVKDLIKYSSNLLGFDVFNYWVRNSDNLLIGKFIGSTGLAIYARAYTIMLMPLTHISGTVGQVMFPSLSKIQDDKIRVKQIYLRSIAMIAVITFPMMTGLLVVAESFVLALFGLQWANVVPLLKIFCLLGAIESISTTIGLIFNSQGRTDLQFIWGIGAGVLLIGSIIFGIWFGTVQSVAICYAVTEGIVLLYPAFVIPGKLINMTFGDVVRSVSGAFSCAALMAAGVYLFGMFLPSGLPHWARLMVQVPLGVGIYLVSIHIFSLKAYVDIRQLLREQITIKFSGS